MGDARRVELRVAVDIYTDDLDVNWGSDDLMGALRVLSQCALLLEVDGEKDSTTVFVKGQVEGAQLVEQAPPSLPDDQDHRMLADYADDLSVRLALLVEEALTGELPLMQLDPAVIDEFSERLNVRLRDTILDVTKGLA